jgi:uroporphyrinogen-III decarboxylase
MGGYDPHFFVGYSLDDMVAEAKRCIDEAANGGGYILASTDSIPEDANWEDIQKVVQAAKEYGKNF